MLHHQIPLLRPHRTTDPQLSHLMDQPNQLFKVEGRHGWAFHHRDMASREVIQKSRSIRRRRRRIRPPPWPYPNEFLQLRQPMSQTHSGVAVQQQIMAASYPPRLSTCHPWARRHSNCQTLLCRPTKSSFLDIIEHGGIVASTLILI